MYDATTPTLEMVLQAAFDVLLAMNPKPKGIEVSRAMLEALKPQRETLCSIWAVQNGYGLRLAGHIDPLWIRHA